MSIASRSVFSAAAMVAVLAACSTPTATNGAIELSVQSDKNVYHLTTDEAAEPILINRGSVAVYLPMNEYVAVQRLENGMWSEPRPWFAVDGIGISFAVGVGDTLWSLPMDFRYVGNTPGVYRFIFDVARDSTGREPVTESLRVSPSFELRP